MVWIPETSDLPSGAPTVVRVRPGTDDDGLAAVEQAVRASLRSGAGLVLLHDGERKARRRIDALQRRLTSLGVSVTSDASLVLETSDGLGVMFVGWTTWRTDQVAEPRATGTVVVRGAPDDHGERLEAAAPGVRQATCRACPSGRRAGVADRAPGRHLLGAQDLSSAAPASGFGPRTVNGSSALIWVCPSTTVTSRGAVAPPSGRTHCRRRVPGEPLRHARSR